ncbi:hypothetical protein SE91_28230 [Bradyrhizobium sp. DOA1]|nr:hypothetical protein SE91_28230 [Bradyrhizobium sp. DOA1]
MQRSIFGLGVDNQKLIRQLKNQLRRFESGDRDGFNELFKPCTVQRKLVNSNGIQIWISRGPEREF